MKKITFSTTHDFFTNCWFGWANANLHMSLFGYDALAFLWDGDEVKGVVILNNQLNETYIDIVAPGYQFTRGILREFFDFCFARPVNRLACQVNINNKRSQRFVETLGFQREGIHRAAGLRGTDLIAYGLLKMEWENGKIAKNTNL